MKTNNNRLKYEDIAEYEAMANNTFLKIKWYWLREIVGRYLRLKVRRKYRNYTINKDEIEWLQKNKH